MKDIYHEIDASIQHEESDDLQMDRRRSTDRYRRKSKARPIQGHLPTVDQQLHDHNDDNISTSSPKYHSDVGAIKRSRVGKTRSSLHSFMSSPDPYGPAPRYGDAISVPYDDSESTGPSASVIFNVPWAQKSRSKERLISIPQCIGLIVIIFMCLNQILRMRFNAMIGGVPSGRIGVTAVRGKDMANRTKSKVLIPESKLIERAQIRASSIRDDSQLDISFDLDDMT